MPKILNYSDFCENLDEVTSLKTFGKKKFNPEGLFSEQIFGPVRNYTCQCGIYHGVSKSGSVCDICGVPIINSDSRRKTFAKIVIPISVVNPLFYDLIVNLGGKGLKKAIDDLMKNDKSILYLDSALDEYVVTISEDQIPVGAEKWERVEAIEELVRAVAENPDNPPEWQIIKDNLSNLLINQIIVLPPELRPTSKSSGETKQLMDKINRYYVQILTKKEIMRDTIIDIQRDKALYYTYFKQLQKDVSELYTRILEKMAKKEGLIRGNILGKRIDFSGRAVISPDPTLSLDECKLPYIMVLEIFKLPIAKRIIQLGKFKLLNKSIDYVNECIENKTPVLLKICKDVTKNEYCILNRQPSLHKLGMLGFKIKITLDSVIKIHPLACPPFNADFDGDQMAVYIPISDDAKNEIKEKIVITSNLSSPSNEYLTTTPSQDIILGIYYLTSEEFSKKIITYKEHKLLIGRAEFNRQLPKDYPVVDKKISEKGLLRILNDIKNKYPQEETIVILDNIKKTGFKFATLYGTTMSLKDFPIVGAKKIRHDIFSHSSIRNQLTAFSDPSLIDELKEKFKYSYMIESGARGSWGQVKQLILSRGFISNFDGEILPHPIKNSLVDGLTQKEFFYSTYGCRKGLLDVALNTGTSGYLSRKLIFTCANLQIDKDLDDCGTTDLLEVDVKNNRKARMLINRWALNEEDKTLYKITEDNYKNIIGKIIFIRSPILCKSPKICKKCYGDLYKILNSRFIGIIAAQTLGERGTQLVLRTFHTSGSAVIKGEEIGDDDTSMKQKDIIGDLASVSKLLHKFENKTYTMIVDELFDAYGKDIHNVHFESVVAQLMWRDNKKWRLIENREKVSPKYYSIQTVPNQESWILAMAFSNPKRAILQGILYEGRYSGVMDKILKGEKII